MTGAGGPAPVKAAVIGANSYIARNLARVNREEGYAEALLCDCQPEHMDGEPGYRQIDVFDQGAVERAVEGSSLVYFFVGKTGTLQGFETPGTFLDVNERSLLVMLNACRKASPGAKVVFPSTRLVYRGCGSALGEDAPKQFLTPYAVQKYACEQYLEMYRRLYGISYCTLRICVPYGTLVEPVSSYGTLDFFLRQAREEGVVSVYGDGSQRRTFTYIGDLCRILWGAGLDPRCADDVYNVGGEDCSVREVAEKVAEAEGVPVAEKEWPAMSLLTESGSTVFDSSKLDRILWEPYRMTVDRWIEEKNKETGGIGKMKKGDLGDIGGVPRYDLICTLATAVHVAIMLEAWMCGAGKGARTCR